MLQLASAALIALVLPPLPPLDDPVALRMSHGFSASANWLVPGHVLLGANPTKGRGSTLDRVIAIRCEGGCDTFVSLQAELPPLDAGFAHATGVESYEIEAKSCAEAAPRFVHVPIDDLRPASSLEYLAESVRGLAARVRDGETLYIHCFAGRGRTGLVAACLLGELYEGMDAEEALTRVGGYYALRASYGVAASRAADGRSPETEPQRQQVREYFAAREQWLATL